MKQLVTGNDTPNTQDMSSSELERTERIGLLAILVIAYGVRFAAVVFASDHFQLELTEYQVIARNLVERGYFGIDWLNWSDPDPGPSSFMPPLYPTMLATLMAISSEAALTAMRIIQAVISTLSCFVFYKIACDIFVSNKRIAWLSAIAAAFYPPFVGSVVEINTATFEVAFLAIAIYFLLQSQKRHSSLNLMMAGITLGLAALTKPTALVTLPAALLWLWTKRRRSSLTAIAKTFGVFLIATLITILPWTLRNYQVHHRFVLISTNGGVNFWIGNNEEATGEFVWPKRMNPQLFERAVSLTEVERDRLFFGKGLQFIQTNPYYAMKLFGQKLLYSIAFRPSIGSNYTESSPALDLGRALYAFSYLLVLPFWGGGLLISLLQWRRYILLYGIIAGYIATNVAFFVGTRFRTPVDPYLLMFAALAVVFLWTKLPMVEAGFSLDL